ncbi:hypothetical protein D3C72_1743740 [compost metagenome]
MRWSAALAIAPGAVDNVAANPATVRSTLAGGIRQNLPWAAIHCSVDAGLVVATPDRCHPGRPLLLQANGHSSCSVARHQGQRVLHRPEALRQPRSTLSAAD